MGRDQNDTAARVVHAGAGLRLSPDSAAPRIAKAAARLLAEPAFREGAQRLARAIATREGQSDAVELLEGLAGERRASAAA